MFRLKHFAALTILLGITLSLVSWSRSVKSSEPKAPEGQLKWYTIQEAEALNKKEPRKFFIDVYTQWCGWCKKMDASTFTNPVITDYLSKKYYPVKFDAEIQDTVYFKGKPYTFVGSGMRGYNQLAYDWVEGRLSYPTIVFLDENANTIQAVGGYREAEELDRILKYFGEDNYRKTDYQTFQSTYKSPFSPTGGQ